MSYKANYNRLSGVVLDASIHVHRELGPGLLESAYEICLCHELDLRGIPYQRQVSLPIIYKGVELDCGYRLDIVVDDLIIVELKSVDGITNVHKAQIMTYLKLSRRWLGLLINFNVYRLNDGFHRIVNGYES